MMAQATAEVNGSVEVYDFTPAQVMANKLRREFENYQINFGAFMENYYVSHHVNPLELSILMPENRINYSLHQ